MREWIWCMAENERMGVGADEDPNEFTPSIKIEEGCHVTIQER